MLPNITFHKTLDFKEISGQNLMEVESEIGGQYLILGQSIYNDQVLRSYPYYGGHLSKFDLINLNRNFRFTNFIDPWKSLLTFQLQFESLAYPHERC